MMPILHIYTTYHVKFTKLTQECGYSIVYLTPPNVHSMRVSLTVFLLQLLGSDREATVVLDPVRWVEEV